MQNGNFLKIRYKTIKIIIIVFGKLYVFASLLYEKVIENEFNEFFISVGKGAVDKIRSLASDYDCILGNSSFVPQQYEESEQFDPKREIDGETKRKQEMAFDRNYFNSHNRRNSGGN